MMQQIISEWLDTQERMDSPRAYMHAQSYAPTVWRPYDTALDALRNGDRPAARRWAAAAMEARLRWEVLALLVAEVWAANETQAVRRLEAQHKEASDEHV